MPKVFGIEHLIYLAIVTVIGLIAIIMFKKYVKSDYAKRRLFLILGIIDLILIIICRIAVCIYLQNNNFIYLIPETICGTTSLVLSLTLIFGKKDNIILHAIWFVSLISMTISCIYPSYISQNDSIFFPATIFGLLHHSMSLFITIAILVMQYMVPRYQKAWVQIFYFIYFILIGLFLIYVLKMTDAFYMKEAVLPNTILNFWFLSILLISLEIICFVIIELFRKKRAKN